MPDRLRKGWPFWVLTASCVIGVVALLLASIAVIKWGDTQEQRRIEAAATDLASCERGNDLRAQIVRLGAADQAMVEEILRTVAGPDTSPERAARLEAMFVALEPVFARHREVVDSIQLTDCDGVVNGKAGAG